MTTLISLMTIILILVITLWALWPKLRAWIEQPKYEFRGACVARVTPAGDGGGLITT